MPRFKSGVVMWNMHPKILEVIPTLDKVHNKMFNRPSIITSGREGEHSHPISFHYLGQALDLRIRDLPPAEHFPLVDALRDALGAGFDVVLRPNHIHVEYDPR